MVLSGSEDSYEAVGPQAGQARVIGAHFFENGEVRPARGASRFRAGPSDETELVPPRKTFAQARARPFGKRPGELRAEDAPRFRLPPRGLSSGSRWVVCPKGTPPSGGDKPEVGQNPETNLDFLPDERARLPPRMGDEMVETSPSVGAGFIRRRALLPSPSIHVILPPR